MEKQTNLTPVVAIIGRANVGKSTLFNRLIEKKKAITSSTSGTTRDINFGYCSWRDQVLTIIDTAGLDLTSKEATEKNLLFQAKSAIAKADLVIMLGDAKDGPLPQDQVLAKYLRQNKTNTKKILLAVNKADNRGLRYKVNDGTWLKLGLGEPFPVSAANGSGVGDLLDFILKDFRERGLMSQPVPEPDVKLTLIGRPNVGKSSLLNALAGEERVIVSEIPHTTKEPQDTLLTYTDTNGQTRYILLVDTVGIRKRAKVNSGIERYGVSLSIEEMEQADVALLIVDAKEGVDAQEKKLAGLIERKRVGVLIVIKKWDLSSEQELGTADEFKQYVYGELPFYKFAPIVFVSAKTGNRVGKLLDHALEIAKQRSREITQPDLDNFVEKLKKKHHAVLGEKKGSNRPQIYGIIQIGTKPPSFLVIVKKKETVHPNFLSFIENRLREEFGFEGTPVIVLSREIRPKSKRKGKK